MTYTVGYQTGGHARFTWHKVGPYATREEAETAAADILRMGYVALVYRTHELDAIGLPETWHEPNIAFPRKAVRA